VYEWLFLIHIVGVLGFVFSHGVAAAMALRLRYERDHERIRVLLETSKTWLAMFYPAILLLLVGGIWAGFDGHWWGEGWIWVALGVFVFNLIFMWSVASPYYARVREVMSSEGARDADLGPEQVASLLRSSRPLALVTVGLLSIVFIAYLMVVKPF
jgi:Predicted integral membrane protein (DUF2269)